MAVNKYNLHLESNEEPEQSVEENLFMFLHNAGAHHHAIELFEVFNVDFPLEHICL